MSNDSGKKDRTVSPSPVFRYERGKIRPTEHEPVKEFPLSLIVNGRELATLISSPHDLRFLVAGFLRLQGFVQGLDDFQMFSVCEDFGVANVIIKGEIPAQLKPALNLRLRNRHHLQSPGEIAGQGKGQSEQRSSFFS